MKNIFKDLQRKDHKRYLGGLDVFRYIGPGLLVTVGFIDPGNWASNFAAGSEFGYSLLWVLDLIQKEIKEGMSTAVIDKLVYDYTVGHGAIPAPLNYEGFPKSVCTSINEVVCHGIPSEKEILRDGDIINVDVSTILDGYYSDASRMFMIGNVSPKKQKLVQVAKECLEIGIKAAKPFGFVGDIGNAIQKHAEKNGFSVVRDLCGHGVGLEFHEEPEVCHFGRKGTGMLLVPGMVFTIEPMINMGTWKVFIDEEDGWTVITEDELPSAQWEHTFLMTETGLEILTY